MTSILYNFRTTKEFKEFHSRICDGNLIKVKNELKCDCCESNKDMYGDYWLDKKELDIMNGTTCR